MAVLTGVTCPFLSGVVPERPQIPKEVVKPIREAMEHMAKAAEVTYPRETISKAAVFSKEK
jgi:hypothetical protein